VTETQSQPLVDLERELDGHGPAYLSTLEELTGLLLEEASLEQLLEHLLELTSRAVSTSSAVSVTVVGDDDRFTTVAATSEDALAADAMQYELDEGPCVDSLRTGRVHRLDDLADEDRWPGFRQRAMEVGFGSMLSVPLMAGGRSIGALNVFAAEPHGLTDDDLLLAQRIAAPAATTVANARAYRRATRLADQLQVALDTRALLERAKGVLMARERCTEEQAFALLKRASQERNVKLRAVAELVLQRAGGL
jgi:GAF domain-containing protein